MTPIELSTRYGIPRRVHFIGGNGDLPVALITTPHATAEISLYGAHVLRYQPTGENDLLWMSSQSLFEVGKPIRGGVPVCFPWFGPHPTDPAKPMHGFARLRMWDVVETSVAADQAVRIHLGLQDDTETMSLWPHPFRAEMIISVGAKLTVTFKCTNTGDKPLEYGAALHSYFAVEDIERISIRGLRGGKFYDGPNAPTVTEQVDELLWIRKEENRRYIGTTAECTIEDPVAERTLHVGKRGSRVTVVWNPWEQTSKNLPDVPDDGYKTMVCVEAVNAYDDLVRLDPNMSAELEAIISSV